MEKGSIFYSPNHQFDDGQTSDKLLILLNDPNKSGAYVFVLVTSKQKRRSDSQGCHEERGETYYVINKNIDFFTFDKTWVLLSAYLFWDHAQVLADSLKGNLKETGRLKEITIKSLINCLKRSNFVSGHIAEIVQQ